ncbi:MAG: GFA family protein [Pseudomonadota bacterium]
MISGRCNCGAVTFQIEQAPTDVYVCHCSICRKYTGSNGMPVVIVRKEDFRWLSGQSLITHWKKPDADWESTFCSVCGSSLPGPNDEARMFVPAGLLPDEVSDLEVKHHIFVGSKACWDIIGDSGKQHDERIT